MDKTKLTKQLKIEKRAGNKALNKYRKVHQVVLRIEQGKDKFNDIIKALSEADDFFSNVIDITDNIIIDGVSFDISTLSDLVSDYFAFLVYKQTIGGRPIFLSNEFSKYYIKNKLNKAINEKYGLRVRIYKKLLKHQEYNIDTPIFNWYKFPKWYNDPDQVLNLKPIAKELDIHFLQPILGITNYHPNNIESVMNAYEGCYITIDDEEGQCNNILDMEATANRLGLDIEDADIRNASRNIDIKGLKNGILMLETIYRFCKKMINNKKFNHVVNPKNFQDSHIPYLP